MKPQVFTLESEILEEFRIKMNAALETVTRLMIEKKLPDGTITAKIDIEMLERTDKETGEIYYDVELQPNVNMKISAGGKIDCDKKGDKGDTGEKGDTGAQGATGATGAQGPQGVQGPAGQGVPTGGTAGKFLKKLSGDDYDAGWADADGESLKISSGSSSTIREYFDGQIMEIIEEYDENETYSIGQYVMHNELIYRCKTEITTAEEWTSAHWTRAVLANELDKANSIRDDIGIVINGNTAAQNVAQGQYVIVRDSTITGVTDGLYKASSDVASGTAFTSANLTAVTKGAVNELSEQIGTLNSKIGGIVPSNYAQETKTASTVTSVAANSDSSSISVDVSKSGYTIVGILGVSPGNTNMSIQSFQKGSGNNVSVIVHNWTSSARNAQPEIICIYLKTV